MATIRGIPLSKVSPAFLHANSTSHTWVFSAFAELIDNAYDPDVSASELLIDKIDIRGIPCLIFLDNGAGVDRDHLLKMLSFGFCEKDVYEKQGSHQPIGHYGNGFKSGSMRIGQDALVFTRCQTSASIGFLSQTYLAAIQADCVVVPILDYRLPSLERVKSQESRNNLNAILEFSVFKSEDELKEELKALEGSKTGTKIIISNLKRLQDSTYELDFASDPRDIRCPEAHEIDMTSVYHRPIQQTASEYKRSLREYCSILFLRPRMKITIRGVRVKSKLISKSLSKTEIDLYKPTWLSRPVKIIFGFTCEKGRPEDYDYGMMLYHRNRLIKAFEKVGYQKQPNGLGVGVVGVAQVDFLQPIHNKQDFNKDEKFNSVMAAFANKLNDYWNEKKGSGSNGLSSVQPVRNLPDWLWAQCNHCLKWRRLPDVVDPESLPDNWYCRMNPDATHNRCDIPEEPEDEDLAVKPTYEKTFKKKQEERKRLQHMERLKEEEAKRRKIMLKERELKQKEATLRAIQQVAAAQPENRAVTSLQRALAEARRKEDQQKRMILQIQEQKKRVEEQRNSLLQMAEHLQAADGKDKKDVLEQMSKLIGSFNSNHTSASSMLPGKRKSNEETPSTSSTKGGKKMCIKTETGEMLSITENDVGSDDSDDIIIDHNSSALPPRKHSDQSKENDLPTKTDPEKRTSRSQGSSTASSLVSSAVKNMKQTVPIAESLLKIIGAAAENASHTTSSSSAPKSRRKRPQKDTVMAVIDLTSESEFGELVDIKPDLNGLRTTVQENLQEQEDIKPDIEVLDDEITKKDDSNKQKTLTSVLTDTKQETSDPPPQSVAIASVRKVPDPGCSESELTDDKITFGPAEDDPELPGGNPENFQANLEATIAAIQEKIQEKQEQERKDVSVTKAMSSKTIDESENEVVVLSDELKTEKLIQLMPAEHVDEEILEAGGVLKIDDEVVTEDNKLGTEKEDSMKDVPPNNDDNGGNSDFDGLEDDDSDYRDYTTLYEKGDSSESYTSRQKCDRAGSSRNNSIEDGGGSSNQGISGDWDSSARQDSIENPNGKHIDVNKHGSISDNKHDDTSDNKHDDTSDNQHGGTSDNKHGSISNNKHDDTSGNKHGGTSGNKHGDISNIHHGDTSDNKHGGTSDPVVEEPNTSDCLESKINCELKNREGGASSKMMAREEENAEGASVDYLTKEKNLSCSLSCREHPNCREQQSPVHICLKDSDVCDGSIDTTPHGFEDHGEPLRKGKVEGCEDESTVTASNESPVQLSCATNEDQLDIAKNLNESSNLVTKWDSNKPLVTEPNDSSQPLVTEPNDFIHPSVSELKSSQILVRGLDDCSQMLVTELNDSSQYIVSGLDDFSQSLVTELDSCSQTLATEPDDSSQAFVPEPDDSSHSLATEPDDASQLLTTEPDDSSQPLVTEPDDSSQPLVTEPDDASQPLITEPDDSSQPLVTEPDDSSQPLVTEPDVSSQPLVTAPDGSSQPLGSELNESKQPLITELDGCSQTLVTEPDDSSHALVSGPDDSSQTLITALEYSSQTSVTEPDDSSQTLITALEYSSQTSVTEPDDSSQILVTEPDNSSQALVSGPDDSSQALVSALEYSSQTLITEQDDSSQALVSGPDDSSQTLISALEYSSQTLVTEPDDSSQTLITAPDDSSQTSVTEPDDSSQILVPEPDDSSQILVPELDDSSQSLVTEPDDFSHTVTEPGVFSQSLITEQNESSQPLVNELDNSSQLITKLDSSQQYTSVTDHTSHEKFISEKNQELQCDTTSVSLSSQSSDKATNGSTSASLLSQSSNKATIDSASASLQSQSSNKATIDSASASLQSQSSHKATSDFASASLLSQSSDKATIDSASPKSQSSNKATIDSASPESQSFDETTSLPLSHLRHPSSSDDISDTEEQIDINRRIVVNNVTDQKLNDKNMDVKIKNKQQCVLDKKAKDYNLNGTNDQHMQTDFEMPSVSEILRLKEDVGGGRRLCHQDVHVKNELISEVDKVDKSFQTSGLEQVLSVAESQTEEIEWKSDECSTKEAVEELKTKLLLKNQHLEEIEKKLTEINVNIHKLLRIIVPETELGDVKNINQIIKDMIQVHEDNFQQSKSQDDTTLS